MSGTARCARRTVLFLALLTAGASASAVNASTGPDTDATSSGPVVIGDRPRALVEDMDPGPLKERLQACSVERFQRTDFSIGHRGAPLRYPEHTRESYIAAAQMGAGILECDVTFTKDRQLVCRHAQDDLHSTTNIVTIPELNAKCSRPFEPADPRTGRPASAECRTSDITLAEFKQLEGKMPGTDRWATTAEGYLNEDPTDRRGMLMSHAESIQLFKALGVKFTPELKTPVEPMPFQGEFSQQDYARQMVQAYQDAGVDPSRVWPQSFNLTDVQFWIENAPDFGRQAVLLDSSQATDETTSVAYLKSLKEQGVNILAPALWKLLSLNDEGRIVPSRYALNAREAGLTLIAWTIERSGSLADGGGWYYTTISDAINNDGDVMTVIDVLAREVGVTGLFSDWPATTTFYYNCLEHEARQISTE